MDIFHTSKIIVDEDNVHKYANNEYHRHGKLGKINTEDTKILQETRKNFDNLKADVEKGKKIMYNVLFINDIATDVKLPLTEYGFYYINNMLIFQCRDKKSLVNKYLFNIITGEVYYINIILMDNININKYHEYDKIISEGIPSALLALKDYNLFISGATGSKLI